MVPRQASFLRCFSFKSSFEKREIEDEKDREKEKLEHTFLDTEGGEIKNKMERNEKDELTHH